MLEPNNLGIEDYAASSEPEDSNSSQDSAQSDYKHYQLSRSNSRLRSLAKTKKRSPTLVTESCGHVGVFSRDKKKGDTKKNQGIALSLFNKKPISSPSSKRLDVKTLSRMQNSLREYIWLLLKDKTKQVQMTSIEELVNENQWQAFVKILSESQTAAKKFLLGISLTQFQYNNLDRGLSFITISRDNTDNNTYNINFNAPVDNKRYNSIYLEMIYFLFFCKHGDNDIFPDKKIFETKDRPTTFSLSYDKLVNLFEVIDGPTQSPPLPPLTSYCVLS